MSVKISGKVWELNLDPTEKLILLALAEYADHDGNNVRPGNELLHQMTGLSERTIGLKITEFLKRGILEPVDVATGRGNVRVFSLNPNAGQRKPYFITKEQQKAERASTFKAQSKVERASTFDDTKAEQASTFTEQKVEAGAQKVEAGAQKVEADGSAYKEENRHENRHEPTTTSADLLADPIKSQEQIEKRIQLLAERITSLYRLRSDWQLSRQIETIAGQLDTQGATVEEVQRFWDWRRSKPSLRYFFDNLMEWRLKGSPATELPKGGNYAKTQSGSNTDHKAVISKFRSNRIGG